MLFLPPWVCCCCLPLVLSASCTESVRSSPGAPRETLWARLPSQGLPPLLAVLPSLPLASPAGEVAGCHLVLLPRLLVAREATWFYPPDAGHPLPPTAVVTVYSDVADSASCESRAWSPQWGPGTLGHEVKMCE